MKIYALATKNKDDEPFESSINFTGSSIKNCYLNKENAESVMNDISTSLYPLKVVEFEVADSLFHSEELKDIASKVKWRSQ